MRFSVQTGVNFSSPQLAMFCCSFRESNKRATDNDEQHSRYLCETEPVAPNKKACKGGPKKRRVAQGGNSAHVRSPESLNDAKNAKK